MPNEIEKKIHFPPSKKENLWRRYYLDYILEGLTQEELAHKHNTSFSTVRRAITWARHQNLLRDPDMSLETTLIRLNRAIRDIDRTLEKLDEELASTNSDSKKNSKYALKERYLKNRLAHYNMIAKVQGTILPMIINNHIETGKKDNMSVVDASFEVRKDDD